MIGAFYEHGLRGGNVEVEYADGRVLPLAAERWLRPIEGDEEVLARCGGPTLDVGSGPGRLTSALARRGVFALGIDVTPLAVELTRRAGGLALLRCVFDPLPATGRWAEALLMDGNIGIGGDPAALLDRLARVVTADGLLIVETVPDPEVDERILVQVTDAHGSPGELFPWARVGTPALLRHARACGWHPEDRWSTPTRTFATLRAPTRAPADTTRTDAR